MTGLPDNERAPLKPWEHEVTVDVRQPVPAPEQPAREQGGFAVARALASEYPKLYKLSKNADESERLGRYVAAVDAEIGAAMHELWLARTNARASVSADTPPTTLTAALPDGSVLDGHAPSPAPVTLDEPAAAKAIRKALEIMCQKPGGCEHCRKRAEAALDALLADRARLEVERDALIAVGVLPGPSATNALIAALLMRAKDAEADNQQLRARCERAEEALRDARYELTIASGLADPTEIDRRISAAQFVIDRALAAAGAGEETRQTT